MRTEGKKTYQAAVITLSDKGSKGEREDKSGPAIVERLTQKGYEVVETLLLPDDESMLKTQLLRWLTIKTGRFNSDYRRYGACSQRDITPEATLAVATKVVPGIAEAMRALSLQITKRAMLSRAVSVIRKEL